MITDLHSYVRETQFDLPAGIHLAAILLFSLTGALAAMQRGYDLVGVFTVALVVGTGGGLLRDGLFLQQGPPMVTRDWRYIPAVLAACVIAWGMNRWVLQLQRVIAILDAVGLSLYSLVGLFEALRAGLSTPAAVLVGVVNAAGGGLLRDILTREEPLMLKPGQFYVLASLTGCLVFVALGYGAAVPPENAAWIAVGATFLLRILAIIFNWRTSPLQPLLTDASSSGSTTSSTTSPPGGPLQKP